MHFIFVRFNIQSDPTKYNIKKWLGHVSWIKDSIYIYTEQQKKREKRFHFIFWKRCMVHVNNE